jgi:hypothetical protein
LKSRACPAFLFSAILGQLAHLRGKDLPLRSHVMSAKVRTAAKKAKAAMIPPRVMIVSVGMVVCSIFAMMQSRSPTRWGIDVSQAHVHPRGDGQLIMIKYCAA